MASCCFVPVQLLWCVGNRKMQRYYKKLLFLVHAPPPPPLLGNERCTRMVEQCIEPQWSQPMNNSLPQTPASVLALHIVFLQFSSMSFVVRMRSVDRASHNNWVWGRRAGCTWCARDTPILTTPRSKVLRGRRREVLSGHYKVRNGPTWQQV